MTFDMLVRGATVYDGGGGDAFVADVATSGDRIAAIGDLADAEAASTVDAKGLALVPGFVNVLSHSYVSMLKDRRSLSELVQGVTTQIFGEGASMGPLNDTARSFFAEWTGDDTELPWDRLSDYMSHAESVGLSQNIASLVGAHNPRICVVGLEDRPPTPAELDEMCALVAEEMADGALGIGSALIYPPGSFAATDELVALCRAAAPYGGVYLSHLRSEGDALLDAVDELLTISREAEVPAEIWHLKAAGRANWPTMDRVIERLETERAAGHPVSANVYPYLAGATALAAAIPPQFAQGTRADLVGRLADPGIRAQVREAVAQPGDGWENLFLAAGGAEGIVVLSVSDDALRELQGLTLAEIASRRGDDPIDALIDLVRRDVAIGAAFFMMSEDNLRRQLALPWVSVGSDAESIAAEGAFLDAPTHPRGYGTFARVLGRYARDEQVLSLPEAVRRMTSLPAETFGLRDRGRIAEGSYADLVVLDPATVGDRATYADPHRYAVGVSHVIVNGVAVLRDGQHTGAFPGRALRRGR